MSIELKPLDQQVIVITGATSGIGLTTAHSAAKAGAKLMLAARSEQTLREITNIINNGGGHAAYFVADVANRQQVERVAEVAIAEFGRIDTWVNNAGVSIYGRLDEVSEDDSRRLFDTNFWGVVNGSLVALKYLKKQGGALINMGSEVSDAVVPLQAMYSASKHAVKGFTDGLRLEIEKVDKAQVSITLIQPTAVNTPYPQHARNYLSQEAKLPDPQIDPQQVADAILDAAVKPRRDVTVGAMSKINTTVAKMMPGLGDKMAAKQVNTQHYNAPARNPAGALHATTDTGRTHGRTPQETHAGCD